MYELIVDTFAGGGGASAGIEMALGRAPDIVGWLTACIANCPDLAARAEAAE